MTPSKVVALEKATTRRDELLPTQGLLTKTGWDLPANLTEQSWMQAGLALAEVEGAVNWWLGDWWRYGEHKYGDRKALVESEEWTGPAYQTCRNAGAIAAVFETSRRRDVVPFHQHAELASLPAEEADRLLDWCEDEHRKTGRCPTHKSLRDRVKQVKAWLAQGWTQSQLARRALVEDGQTVVASKRDNGEGKQIDAALIAWADQQGLMVEIGRNTDWGNPFEMPGDGDRQTVCKNYREHYLPHKPSLQKKIGTLKGKVLVCWCHPEECHGDHLSRLSNDH